MIPLDSLPARFTPAAPSGTTLVHPILLQCLLKPPKLNPSLLYPLRPSAIKRIIRSSPKALKILSFVYFAPLSFPRAPCHQKQQLLLGPAAIPLPIKSPQSNSFILTPLLKFWWFNFLKKKRKSAEKSQSEMIKFMGKILLERKAISELLLLILLIHDHGNFLRMFIVIFGGLGLRPPELRSATPKRFFWGRNSNSAYGNGGHTSNLESRGTPRAPPVAPEVGSPISGWARTCCGLTPNFHRKQKQPQYLQKTMDSRNFENVVDIQEKKYHPELPELTLEIIKNCKKMGETQEDSHYSVVEPIDIMEKYSSVNWRSYGSRGKAQEVEIGTGLDQKAFDKDGKQSIDSGRENECPPLLTENFKKLRNG
ncbi:hypothetical protein VP01_990g1 [Puccinia sorghi]|uniref:Uncharacterized protein n=1 Tax=Puccinia sorghi TaxID=27349 RepID=A0A0L6U5F5_9BASI|nr:hypothetical protein VP01_990g1 [Puccinia sorghi]